MTLPCNHLKEHEAAILKFGTPAMVTLCTVIKARYDAILDQSEHAHPYDHLSEHYCSTKIFILEVIT